MTHFDDMSEKYPDAYIEFQKAETVTDYLIDQHEAAINIVQADLEEGGLTDRDSLAAKWIVDAISHNIKVLQGYAQGDGPQPPDELLA